MQSHSPPAQLNRSALILLTALAMVAFAGNSLLCRLALRGGDIDAASFTALRIISGAAVLWLVLRTRAQRTGGNWPSALALFVYAAAFSFAYLSLAAGTGALLLFAAVQATMIGFALSKGERLHGHQWFGLVIAFAGLVLLLLPGIAAPPLVAALLMFSAGVAWGVYSLRGKRIPDATAATAGNFIRAVPFALILALACWPAQRITPTGFGYAFASGALTSGLGYVIWYAVLPSLPATSAATVQLSAPVIAALGGVLLLGELMTLRILLAAVAVLGGIALVITPRRAAP
ncbi:MAG: DMT family transporter [Chthoniobacterales bacterium]